MKYTLALLPFELKIEKKIFLLANSITQGLKNCKLHKKLTKDGFGLKWPLEC